jgi:hypothetical protein
MSPIVVYSSAAVLAFLLGRAVVTNGRPRTATCRSAPAALGRAFHLAIAMEVTVAASMVLAWRGLP